MTPALWFGAGFLASIALTAGALFALTFRYLRTAIAHEHHEEHAYTPIEDLLDDAEMHADIETYLRGINREREQP